MIVAALQALHRLVAEPRTQAFDKQRPVFRSGVVRAVQRERAWLQPADIIHLQTNALDRAREAAAREPFAQERAQMLRVAIGGGEPERAPGRRVSIVGKRPVQLPGARLARTQKSR